MTKPGYRHPYARPVPMSELEVMLVLHREAVAIQRAITALELRIRTGNWSPILKAKS